MKGANFDQQNDILGAGNNENCYSLSIARVHSPRRPEDIEADRIATPTCEPAQSIPGIVSFWVLEPGDLEGIIKNGGIYFYCRGHTHPPISLHAESPIAK